MPAVYESKGSTTVAGSTFTFNDLAVAAAEDPKRKLLITGGNYLASGTIAAPTGVTVNGSPATFVHSDDGVSGSTHSAVAWFYIIDFPTGNLADVVVNYASSRDGGGVALYSLTGADDWTYEAPASEYVASVSPMTGTLAVLNGDYVFNVGINRVSSGAGRRFIAASAAILADDASYDIGYATDGTSPVGLTINANDNIGPFASGTRLYTLSIVLRPFIDDGPTVTSIVPDFGSTSGGTVVVITGEQLTGATGVLFDASAGTSFSVDSDTQITVTTPAHAAGLVDVTVQHPDGDVVVTDGFEFTDADVETRVTQVPVLVVHNPNQPVHVTQVPLLVVTVPIQGAKVTQIPVLSLWEPTPVPLPIPVVPEVPVKEVWQWKTALNIFESSREQRSALRGQPRMSMQFSAYILDDTDYRDAYLMMLKYVSNTFNYPMYVYSSKLTAAASAGATKLFFDPAHTDVREGEVAAVYDKHLQTTKFVTISTVDADGANLNEALDEDVPAYAFISPAPSFRVDTPSFSMGSVSGEFSLSLVGAQTRDVLRPDQSSAVDELGGMMLIDDVPLADETTQTKFDQNMEWLDNGIANPEPKTSWYAPFASTEKKYLIHRENGFDTWRARADRMKGRQNTFLMPTFRNDLPVIETPALDATEFVSDSIQFFDVWLSRAWKYVRIKSDAGVVYSRINSVEVNYDASGQPVSITVRLGTSIGADIGSNSNMVVSFVNTYRLDSDEIVLEHYEADTVLTLKVRMVEE